MRVPDHKIEEVRLATDILTVVSEYVALKKRGQNHFGLCPFHDENSPSFSVNQSKQIFRCFGCGRGGNVFGFLMEIERVSFIEALKTFAQRVGIELPKYERDSSEGPSETELLVQANGIARDFFHQQLINNQSQGAKDARNYLTSRGYELDVIEKYMLGFAPDSWDSLAEHAKQSRIPAAILIKAGLLKEGRETNRPYDAYRDRIMFPIRNLAGRVIAFGGRRLHEEKDGEPSAKYVNSPETTVYSKGRELFGLWEARNEIRRQDRAIIVEGYTDTISLVSAGIPIVCASLGTSLTESQARLVKRFTANVLVLYDGDDAGLNAAKRATEVFLSVGVAPKVVTFPPDEDPDTFVKKRGAEATWELINNALSPVEFQLYLGKRAGTSLAQAAKELVQTAANIASPVEQEAYLRDVSAKTGIGVDSLLRELARIRTRPTQQTENRTETWPTPGTMMNLTEILVRRPALRDLVFSNWKPDNVEDKKLREILNYLFDEWKSESSHSAESILDFFSDPPVRNFLARCLSDEREGDEQDLADIDRREAADCLRYLEAVKIGTEIATLKEQLASKPHDMNILSELQSLVKKQKDLKQA